MMKLFHKLRGQKIILVEDDEIIRNALCLAFMTGGCVLLTAETAEQALNELKAESFDIIISDLRLPGINGIEFFKQAQKLHPDSIKILISGQTDPNMIYKVNQNGIHDFVKKPFTIEVLINSLLLALQKQHKKMIA